ncbi:MAG: OmpA family protein [Saprospiraceae bacterium]|nr:OmpA family protein [Saprospiraceae bacterium]
MRKALLLSLSLLCVLVVSNAQTTYLKTAPSSLKKSYQKALDLYKNNQYPKAQKAFEKLIKKSPQFIDAYIILGSIHFDLDQSIESERYFVKALGLDSNYMPKVYYTLSLVNYSNQKYSDAHKNIKKFLQLEQMNKDLISKANKKLKTFHFADSATRNPVISKSTPLSFINSDFSEYLPSLTADGRTMVFTRKINNDNEDLFISYKQDDGQWTSPVDIIELNTSFNEGAPAISPDGNTLVFVSCDRKESHGGCDLYISYKTDKGWSPAANFGDKINSPAYETQPCFSDNGKILVFCSNRIGGLGGRDLWLSFKNKDNTWVKPINLGPDINTPENEECPFLHSDNKTLYFSSDGHPGMGDKDIFMSRMKTLTQWSTPINIGFPINSPLDESSFVAFSSGNKALIASDKSFVGMKDKKQLQYINLDIYEIDIPNHVQPIPSCFVKLKVLDAISQLPLMATIEIYRLQDKKVFFSDKLNNTGSKLISLPGDAEYFISITHPDYTLISENIICTRNTTFNPQLQIYTLFPIEKYEQNTILKNVLFETASANLKEESYFELNKLVEILQHKVQFKIHILGHTDNIGEDIDNLKLSDLRAKSVANYLISKGIISSRISSEGKGELLPVANNDTEEGRALNRRTEFSLKKIE